MFKRVPIGIVIVFVMGLTACGGSESKSDDTSDDAKASPSAKTIPEPKPNATDDRLARASLLKLYDFPTGWAAEDDDDEQSSKSKCPAVVALRAKRTGRADAPSFNMGNDVTKVEHSVAVFAAAEDAEDAYADIVTPETRKCQGKLFAKVFADSAKEDGGEIGDVKTSAVRIEPVGDQVDASRYTVEFSSEGSTVTAYVEQIFVLQDRVISAVGTTDILTTFDDDLRATLLGKIERRTRRALAT